MYFTQMMHFHVVLRMVKKLLNEKMIPLKRSFMHL